MAEETQAPHWWDAAADAFDAWLAKQPLETQEHLTLLEQINLYYADFCQSQDVPDAR
jgi:hypothetical protein